MPLATNLSQDTDGAIVTSKGKIALRIHQQEGQKSPFGTSSPADQPRKKLIQAHLNEGWMLQADA
jgi:hypothetical protein